MEKLEVDDHASLNSFGFEVLEQSAERVRIRVPVEGNRQAFGILHGGVNAALVEEAGSRVSYHRRPEGRVPIGTEINCSNLRPAHDGYVTATATPISDGKSSSVTHVEIHNDDGELTAVGRMTCVYIKDERVLAE